MSLAEEGARVLAPILAAVLIVVVKLEGIILIDIISFIIATGTLLLVPIPQLPQTETAERARNGILKDSVYGFRYFLANPSLLGLQINFLMVNLLAMGAVLRTPMILAQTGSDETILGTVASVTAIGGVAGGLMMSIWGGPKRKILGVLGGLILVNVGRGTRRDGTRTRGRCMVNFRIFRCIFYCGVQFIQPGDMAGEDACRCTGSRLCGATIYGPAYNSIRSFDRRTSERSVL